MKQSRRYILWTIIVTIWTTVCFIMPDFIESPVEGWYGVFLICSYIGLCGIGSFFLIYLIGANKYLSAVVLPIWALIGGGLAFYRIGYHTTLTPMLIDVLIHTNLEETLGVISLQMVAWVVLQLLIASMLIWWRWTKIEVPYAWLHSIFALVLGWLFFTSNARLQNSLCQRFPYSVYYNIQEYIRLQQDISTERSTPDFTIVEQPSDSLTIVLILGEATRADHLQLNGYERETTPRLQTRKNVVSYPYIHTDETHTLGSLPILLTRADSLHSDYQYTEKSFISIFQHADYSTAWISNQDMGSSFTHFLAESDTAVFANAGKSVYVFSQWLDEELVPFIDSVFKLHPAHVLYILHSIGSHWYYNNHVPQDMYFFQPITDNRVITANSNEQIVNSYDNTIRYMDFFVDSVISIIEDKNSLVIYQSDHGEALGENGEYLHANDAAGSHNPACIIWYSDKYAEKNPEKIKALVTNKNKRFRTDYLFYSILYAAGIEAEGDNPDVNIFKISNP